MDWVLLAGRIMLAAVFVMGGGSHFMKYADMTAYARMKKVPLTGAAVLGSGAIAVVGGLFVALGLWADLGGLLIAGFALPVALMMHNFWAIPEPMERMNQMAHFQKNLAMAGGGLIVFYLFRQFGDGIGLTLTDPLFG
jgi:putative oxidoreductase